MATPCSVPTVSARPARRMPSLVGQRFGQWTVTALDHRRGRHTYWTCRCECGHTHAVETGNLKSGRSTRCTPCAARGRRGEANTNFSHGRTDTPEYAVWYGMRQRCSYPPHSSYHLYGARGITVCARWQHSFEHFFADMGPRPSDTHSIERIDNDGHYEPDNCRWATEREQAANRRNARRVTFRGRTMHVRAWEHALGFPDGRIHDRLAAGWSVARALTESVRHR